MGWGTVTGDSVVLVEDYPQVTQSVGPGARVINGYAGENLVFGDLVCVTSDLTWTKADADSSTQVGMLGMAVATITSGQVGLILLNGFVRDDVAWNWTTGGISGQLYVSTSGGTMTQTPPSGTGDQVQVVGYAYEADVIYFNPSRDIVEV